MRQTMLSPALHDTRRWVNPIGRYPRAAALALLAPFAIIVGSWLPGQSTVLAVSIASLFAVVALTVARPWVGTWLYLGVLVLSPNYVGVSLGSLGDWTPTRALGLAVALALIYRDGIRPAAWNPVDWCFALYLMATTLPELFKGETASSSTKLLLWSGLDYGVPYLVLRSAGRDLASARRVVRICAFWAIVVAAFAIAEVVTGTNLFTDVGPQLSAASRWSEGVYRADSLRAKVSFSHPISLGMYAALMLPLTIWLMRRSRGWQRIFGFVATSAVSVTLLTTLSRGPWIGALAALALTIPLQRERARRNSLIAFAAIVTLVTAVYISGATPLTQLVDDSFNPASDAYNNVLYRQSLADTVLPVWSMSPLIGYADYAADGAFSTSFSIDNHYLATLIVQGAMGLVAFGLVVGAALWRCWSTARDSRIGTGERELAGTLVAVVIGQLVVLGTVAMVGLGPQVFWGSIGLCAAPWCSGHASVAGYRD
jgi:hypothetical protein